MRRLKNEVICHYCNKEAELVTGKEVYAHRKDLWCKKFWRCLPCKAYVGCHRPNHNMSFNGTEPLGLLANSRLRYWKKEAHAHFDKIWKDRHMKRDNTYKWLAVKLHIPLDECHIGFFGLQRTKKAIDICQEYFEKARHGG